MRYNPALRNLPASLASKLREAMEARKITVAQLAFQADISKSSLARLVDKDLDRLPDTYTLVKLAYALDVNLDYLLGLSLQQTEAEISFGADFYPGVHSADNTIYEGAFLPTGGAYFIYVCETVPDYLKTMAVLALELGSAEMATAYHARMTALREAAGTVEANGLVLMDRRVIDQLRAGRGLYAGLTGDEIADQLASLTRFFDAQSPTLGALVVEYHTEGLTPVFLSSPSRVLTRLGDGYVAAGNSQLYQHLRQQALTASRKGVPLGDHLSAPSGAAGV